MTGILNLITTLIWVVCPSYYTWNKMTTNTFKDDTVTASVSWTTCGPQ